MNTPAISTVPSLNPTMLSQSTPTPSETSLTFHAGCQSEVALRREMQLFEKEMNIKLQSLKNQIDALRASLVRRRGDELNLLLVLTNQLQRASTEKMNMLRVELEAYTNHSPSFLSQVVRESSSSDNRDRGNPPHPYAPMQSDHTQVTSPTPTTSDKSTSQNSTTVPESPLRDWEMFSFMSNNIDHESERLLESLENSKNWDIFTLSPMFEGDPFLSPSALIGNSTTASTNVTPTIPIPLPPIISLQKK